MGKYVAPSVRETAFSCPHCGAFAKQFWHAVCVSRLDKDKLPPIWTAESVASYNFNNIEEDRRSEVREFLTRYATGRPFLETSDKYHPPYLINVSVSRCFNCDQFSLWLYDRLLWPSAGTAPEANADMPPEVRDVYEEASRIVETSPRGASALLRLAVQHICIHLGQTGRSLDRDIAELVRRGLDQRVQVALDVVRVVGNNAVHPGQIDLRDNVETAGKLFGLVNLICDIMISQPLHLSQMFADLPAGAKRAIERRDGREPPANHTQEPGVTPKDS